jgi:hypothetical protein
VLRWLPGVLHARNLRPTAESHGGPHPLRVWQSLRSTVSVQCVRGWLAARESPLSKRSRLANAGRATPAHNPGSGHRQPVDLKSPLGCDRVCAQRGVMSWHWPDHACKMQESCKSALPTAIGTTRASKQLAAFVLHAGQLSRQTAPQFWDTRKWRWRNWILRAGGLVQRPSAVLSRQEQDGRFLKSQAHVEIRIGEKHSWLVLAMLISLVLNEASWEMSRCQSVEHFERRNRDKKAGNTGTQDSP